VGLEADSKHEGPRRRRVTRSSFRRVDHGPVADPIPCGDSAPSSGVAAAGTRRPRRPEDFTEDSRQAKDVDETEESKTDIKRIRNAGING
jgi:hypothetical protein